MGYIEIFRLDEQGAGWVDLSEATPQEKLDLVSLELEKVLAEILDEIENE